MKDLSGARREVCVAGGFPLHVRPTARGLVNPLNVDRFAREIVKLILAALRIDEVGGQ